MDLKQLDLNLLLVFNQMMIERRVSSVAETLGVSQPAVSNALKRLRRVLNDDLFVRTAQGMAPTHLAEQLAEPIAYSLDTIKSALSQRSTFDPASSTQNFMIGMTDIGEMYFLPTLLSHIDKVAPSVTISTVRSSSLSLKEDMENGHVDAAIGLLPQLQGSFFRQRLFRQKYVCAMRKNHPLTAKKKITLEDFQDAQHLVVISLGTGHGEVDNLLDKKGIKRRIRITVPHFVAVGHMLQATDLVAMLPERLVLRLAQPFGLEYQSHPVKLPDHSIDLFWHARLHRDPANQWLRRLMFELFAK